MYILDFPSDRSLLTRENRRTETSLNLCKLVLLRSLAEKFTFHLFPRQKGKKKDRTLFYSFHAPLVFYTFPAISIAMFRVFNSSGRKK